MTTKQDNILFVYAWEANDWEKIADTLEYQNIREIHFHYYVEFDIHFYTKRIVNVINHKNIIVRVCTCAYDAKWVFNRVASQNIRSNLIDIQLWPTFWFNKTADEISNNPYYQNDIKNFKHPYLTFNGVAKYHRTSLIDLLYKNELLDKGIVTYHQTHNNTEQLKWKYYSGERLYNAYDNFKQHLSSYMFGESFVSSFLHIPTESSLDTSILSEKTASPILCKLPFLTLGPPNYHKDVIQGLGFELYDEIFDYSFDSEPDLEKRIEKLLVNVKMVCEHPDLNDLYKKIKDKCFRNYYRAMHFVFNKDLVPHMIKEYDTNEEHPSWDWNNFRHKNFIEYSNNLTYNVWHNINVGDVIDDVNQYNPKKITFFGETEFEIHAVEKYLIDYLYGKGIEVTILHGGCPGQYYTDRYHRLNVPRTNVKFWETYWMYDDDILLRNTGIDYQNYVAPTEFKYPYINLNNKNHLHRCALVEELTKEGILDKGIVTWHNFGGIRDYPFQYFDNQIRKLDDSFDIKLDPALIPQEFHDSFFHLVSESTDRVIFITEKTIFPIMMKKPFASMAAPGFHRKLEELGFVLYTELIDYDFDTVESPETRASELAKQVKKVTEITNCSETYKSLLPKLEHNYNNYIKIISSKASIPTEIIDRVIFLRSSPKFHRTGQDNKYLEIFKLIESRQ